MLSKRSKAVACTTCRKNKTRCEVLRLGSARCHRCDVVGASCSYEDNNSPASTVVANDSSASTPDFVRGAAQAAALPSSADSTVPITDSGGESWTNTPCVIMPLPESAPQSNHLWSFIPQRLDWSAPISAIQALLQQAGPYEVLPHMASDETLHDILAPSEIEQLILM